MDASSIRKISRQGRAAAVAFSLAFAGTLGAPFILPAQQAAHAATVSVTVREKLTPYGQWRTSAAYGDIWVPKVAAGWRPYTNGRWVWTNEGWYWQSFEPFGPIAFHYGNWVFDPELGWVWIAGDQWAPAWVVWRQSDDVIGWVPAPPPQVKVVVAESWWDFVPVVSFASPHLLPLIRPVSENVTIVNKTTILNETVVENHVDRGHVTLGGKDIPINAGPALDRLPRTVVASVKAAQVAPPTKGEYASAHLDDSKGEALKHQHMGKQPENSAQATTVSSGAPGPKGGGKPVMEQGAGAQTGTAANQIGQNGKHKTNTMASGENALPNLPSSDQGKSQHRHKPVMTTLSGQGGMAQAGGIQQPGRKKHPGQSETFAQIHGQAPNTMRTAHMETMKQSGHKGPPQNGQGNRRIEKCDPHEARCKLPG